MGGYESPFGREFDSLADIVSFGVAPAFLVHRVVLKDVFGAHAEIGWFIASIYVICGALRLARFNCLASMPGRDSDKEFVGFPIPAAGGIGGVGDFVPDLDGNKRLCSSSELEIRVTCPSRFSFHYDGESCEVSHLQAH